MNDLTRISRGEVFYIISRPAVGSEQKSGRPAVVVSNNMCNEFSPCVEICYLTLQEKNKLPTHVFVDRGPCINSTILCEQVTTISKERIGEYMCILPDDIMDAVDKAIIVSLGLDYIIEQETKKPVSVTPTPAKAEIPKTTLEELDKLRAKVSDLEAFNKELITARDHFRKQAEEAQVTSSMAETYKTLYNELLDKVLRR